MAAFPQDDSSADDNSICSDWSNVEDFYDALAWSGNFLQQTGDEGLGDRLATCTVVDPVTENGVRRLDTNFQTSNGDPGVETAGMQGTVRPEDLLLSDQTTSQSNIFQLDAFIDELCCYPDAPSTVARQQIVDEIVEGIASRLSASRSTPRASYAYVNPQSAFRSMRSRFGSSLSITNQNVVDQIVDGVASRLSASKSTPKASAVYIPTPVQHVSTMPIAHADQSDCSWDEQDRLEKFYAIAQTKLQSLKDQATEHKFVVTRYLDRRKRRVIHALAHLRRLNHMSVDRSRERRILISTASIDDSFDLQPRKCWNETTTSMLMDPMTVVLRVPSSIPRLQIDAIIERVGFGYPIPWSYSHTDGTYYEYSARFRSAGDAATVWDRLQPTRMIDSIFTNVKVTYRTWHRPRPPAAPMTKIQTNVHKSKFQRQPLRRHTWSSTDPPENAPQNPSFMGDERDPFVFKSTLPDKHNAKHHLVNQNETSISTPDEDSSDYSSSASLSSSKRSFSEYFDDWSEFGYLGPNEDGALEDDENPSDTKPRRSGPRRKKRLPKRSNGYQCRHEGCDKVFDYDGDRVKHEKVHKPREEWPHGCQHCHMRFMDQKDVRRHEKTHSKD